MLVRVPSSAARLRLSRLIHPALGVIVLAPIQHERRISLTSETDTEVGRVLAWHRGEDPGPWSIDLFPTFRCNLTCGICLQQGIPDRKCFAEEMPDERWLRLIDEGAEFGVRRWVIGGGGEPMVRGDLIVSMCERIRAGGMDGALQTNGTRFTNSHLERLVKCGWQDISVSVDAPDGPTNDLIRSKGAFEKATTALERLAEIKKERGSALPRVYIPSVITEYNWNSVLDLVDYAQRVGANGMILRRFISAGGDMEQYSLTAAALDGLRDLLPQAKQRAAEFGIDFGSEFTLEKPGTPPPKPQPCPERLEGGPWVKSLCYFPWLNLSVFPTGMVNTCCGFWLDHGDSLRDHSLREVWCGDFMESLRKDMLRGEPPLACRDWCQSSAVHRVEGIRDELAPRLWREWEQSQFPATPLGFARKAIQGVRKHGLVGSIKRGREWAIVRFVRKTGS